MIKWLLDEFLLILLLIIPYDCVNFISFASYRNNHRKEVKFWPKIKIPTALDIKNWGFQLKRAGGGSWDKKMQQIFKKIDRWPWPLTADQAVRRAGNLKHPLPRFISHIFSSIAWRPFTYLLPEAILGWILDWLKAWTCFWDRFELGLGFETQGFSLWERLLFALRASGLF